MAIVVKTSIEHFLLRFYLERDGGYNYWFTYEGQFSVFVLGELVASKNTSVFRLIRRNSLLILFEELKVGSSA